MIFSRRILLTWTIDTEKRKYFKIEKSHTAPSAAAWSSDEVKRRKIQDRAGQAARQREYLVRNHIKRSGLARDIVTSGVLARELGEGRAAELGRGRAEDGDVGAAAWSAGVVEKGCIPFAPSFARARFANMSCFYVSGDDSKTGLGVAYASKSGSSVQALASRAIDGRGVLTDMSSVG